VPGYGTGIAATDVAKAISIKKERKDPKRKSEAKIAKAGSNSKARVEPTIAIPPI
jgi:hypothetical protein